MADYGFRISKTGIDVKTGDDEDMVLTSKYSLLKGTLSGSGTKNVVSGIQTTVTVSHNLGYIPFIQAYIKLPSEVVLLPTDKYIELPQPFVSTGVEADAYFHKSTTTILTIDFYWEDFTATYPDINVDYQYFIYLDKGDL